MKFNVLKSCCLLLVALVMSVSAFAQSRSVDGNVYDEKGQPIQGANVRLKGTDKGVTADNNGYYKLTVDGNNAVIVVSYVGFTPQELKVGDKTKVDVYMASANNPMNEVVVVGYGTQKRANVTGAISTLKASEVEDLPVANLSAALINKLPGVAIGVSAGKPGASVSVTIRGAFSFNGQSVAPLYVIDGITYDGTTNGTPNGQLAFDNLDASEIETFSFLKDAAAAVYGARGANGVVLVTTKRGKAGKIRVSYSGSYGINTAAHRTQMLDAYDQAVLINAKYPLTFGNNLLNNGGSDSTYRYSQAELNYLKTHNYDAFNQYFQSSYLQRHTVNISGGASDGKLTYFAGANYYNQNGNLVGGNIYSNRYGLRFGATAKPIDGLTVDVSLSTDNSVQNQPTPKNIPITDQYDQENALFSALLLSPQWLPTTINGNPVHISNSSSVDNNWNIAGFLNSGSYQHATSNGISLNSSVNYQIPGIKGLTARVQYGLNNRYDVSREYYVPYTLYNYATSSSNSASHYGTENVMYSNNLLTGSGSNYVANNGNTLALTSASSTNTQLNESLNYNTKFGKSELTILGLAEQLQGNSESARNVAFTQIIPGVDQFYGFSQTNLQAPINSVSQTGRLSYLGRINYAYNEKYLLEGIIRADASPNFPPKTRWGYFPSIGAGWKLSEENFFKNNVKFINDLKIRLNVGLIGDDNTPAYTYYQKYTAALGASNGYLFGPTGTFTNALAPGVSPNPDITWATSLDRDLGIDASFFNRKATLTMDGYYYTDYNRLQQPNSSLPATFGSSVAYFNYAKDNRYGFEAAFNYNGKVGKDFTYIVGVNYNITDNRVLQEYVNNSADTGLYSYRDPINHRTDLGIEGYQSTGIVRTQAEADAFNAAHPGWTINGQKLQAGELNFKDINGDGKIDASDLTRIALRSGPIMGFGFNVGAGYKGLRLTANIGFNIGGSVVYDKTARTSPTEDATGLSFWKDSWTPANTNAAYPRIGSPYADQVSSFWVRNATSMRINNMQLSYALPARIVEKFHVPTVRLYIVGTNLWDIINPLPYKYSASNVAVDYPMLRTFTFGINLGI